MDSSQPLFSVIVCTRNRGALVVGAIETILANTYPHFELLLIDQSEDDTTARAVEPFLSHPQFTYVSSTTKGLSRARNLGLYLAQGSLAAFTDDDCIVPDNWLETMADIMVRHPQVAVAFCSVIGFYQSDQGGYIPERVFSKERLIGSVWGLAGGTGIGASMVVRPEAALSVGGFDEALGRGAIFHSGEDADMVIRLLLNNWHLYQTAEVELLHYGVRAMDAFRDLTKQDWFGLGTVYAKCFKSTRMWSLLAVGFIQAVRLGLWQPLSLLAKGRRPRGFNRFIYFVKGLARGLKTAVSE